MLNNRTTNRRGTMAALTLVSAMALTACGSSSSSSSSAASATSAADTSTAAAAATSAAGATSAVAGATSAAGATTAAAGATSAAAGATSAAAPSSTGGSSGARLPVPAKTIGIWQSQADGEGEATTTAAIKAADAALGWKTVVTDSNGNVQAMASTMQSLVNQKVDAIFTVFVATGLIGPQLAAAKAAGIPVISVGYAGTPSKYITAEYAPDQTLEAKMLLARMGKDLPKGGKVGPIAVQGYQGIDEVLAVLHSEAAQYHFTVLNVINADVADVFGSETKGALTLLNGNPDLAALFGALDISTQTIAPALSQLNRNVPIYGFGAIQSGLPFVRKGIATVVTSDGTGKAGYLGVDSLLNFWTKKTPIPTTVPTSDAFQYKIVDKTNAPPAGQAVYPVAEYATPFLTKWASEFTLPKS